ncbi:hypothetical protein M3N55_10590 [Roseibaca sp. V10]|uniref:Uncharacterized protein n=1 Tax=Roseinatronobacter domitianus TaxID=2940293 RepID=A0ABT0M2V1_9RHOB|nr:hypothetical protein [Roseibaca domitiana]MCL1629180.1 hypothetical protein [Roseibaca domitiana]
MRVTTDLSLLSRPMRPRMATTAPPPPPPTGSFDNFAMRVDASAPAVLFSDSAATQPAAVGHSVAHVADLSGLSNHATQPIVAARPVARQSGALSWLEFDGLDDRMVLAADPSWRGTDMSIMMVVRLQAANSPGARVIAGGVDGSYVALYQNGSTSTALGQGNARYANGAFITGTTRGDLYTAWVRDDWVIVEVAGVNFSEAIFNSGVQFPGWRSDSNLANCEIAEVLILSTADADTNRADIVAALTAKFGITP